MDKITRTAPARPASFARRAAVAGAALPAAATVSAAYAPSFACAEGAPPVVLPAELTDFGALPPLPAGMDPAARCCELHLATG